MQELISGKERYKDMTLKDSSHGPDWVLWVIIVLFACISILLLSGHGAHLIAGYNTASREDQEKYDTKKLCRVMGGGMSVITILLLAMAVGEAVLPAYMAYVCLGVILADCAVMIILANTICRK